MHGREALSYATLQEGMEYFVHPLGYIAFTTVTHPVFARNGRRIALSDPLCAHGDLHELIGDFLKFAPQACFAVVSEQSAAVMRECGFKVNCVGYEPEIPIQTYNTLGNWKELDLIKRARNEAKREGILIREEFNIEKVSTTQLNDVSGKWIAHKKVNDREIWIYARRPVFAYEEDVRKFVAYDQDGKVAGFNFYDPMYAVEAFTVTRRIFLVVMNNVSAGLRPPSTWWLRNSFAGKARKSSICALLRS